MGNFILILCFFILVGCKKETISVYTVPKEAPQVLSPAAAPQTALRWEALPKWQSQPPSAMRLATYLIPGKSSPCELSIVSLSGEAGGILANINRWRGQLKQAPLSNAESQGVISHKTFGKLAFLIVNLPASTQSSQGILAAILTGKDDTYFFKLTGKQADIEAARDSFYYFLQKVSLAQ